MTKRDKTSLDRRPSRSRSSGASKSAILTSIQVSGSVVLPTQRLSPSPTYRTMPLNVSPARDGNRPSQGSANAAGGSAIIAMDKGKRMRITAR
jgi:hypothetical protein